MPAAATSARSAPAGPDRPAELRDRGVVRHESVTSRAWELRGTAKIVGDVDVGGADLAGAITVGRELRAETLALDGRLEVGGGLQVRGSVRGRGELRIATTLRAGTLELRGRLAARGAVEVERLVQVTGAFDGPSLTAGGVRLAGSVQLPGVLRAPSVELRLADGARVGAVHASEVRASALPPSIVRKVLGPPVEVRIARIEAERVELEEVDVGFVRAPSVRLGRGARVTAVEGTIVARHPSSHVGPESRSPPPYGLSR